MDINTVDTIFQMLLLEKIRVREIRVIVRWDLKRVHDAVTFVRLQGLNIDDH